MEANTKESYKSMTGHIQSAFKIAGETGILLPKHVGIWYRCSPSTSGFPANHSADSSTLIILHHYPGLVQ
jgi:hypothetical protein